MGHWDQEADHFRNQEKNATNSFDRARASNMAFDAEHRAVEQRRREEWENADAERIKGGGGGGLDPLLFIVAAVLGIGWLLVQGAKWVGEEIGAIAAWTISTKGVPPFKLADSLKGKVDVRCRNHVTDWLGVLKERTGEFDCDIKNVSGVDLPFPSYGLYLSHDGVNVEGAPEYVFWALKAGESTDFRRLSLQKWSGLSKVVVGQNVLHNHPDKPTGLPRELAIRKCGTQPKGGGALRRWESCAQPVVARWSEQSQIYQQKVADLRNSVVPISTIR